jgi:hypothetical protein
MELLIEYLISLSEGDFKSNLLLGAIVGLAIGAVVYTGQWINDMWLTYLKYKYGDEGKRNISEGKKESTEQTK